MLSSASSATNTMSKCINMVMPNPDGPSLHRGDQRCLGAGHGHHQRISLPSASAPSGCRRSRHERAEIVAGAEHVAIGLQDDAADLRVVLGGVNGLARGRGTFHG